MAIAGYVCRMQERTTSKEILPRTSCFSHKSLPSAVQSTSATREVAEPLKSSISLSQSGFSFLQWPHQGAWNLMKTPLPAVSASQFADVNSVAELPAKTPTNKTAFNAMVLRENAASQNLHPR